MEKKISFLERDYRTVNYVTGPLIFVQNVKGISYGEMVEIISEDGSIKNGQVLECSEKYAVVQVFEGTDGIDVASTKIRFREEVAKLGVSVDMLGRIFNGRGDPVDGGPPVLPEGRVEVSGIPLNPFAREKPADFIQTGISAIDGLNTLVRGQKLP
ncbi:MAG: V-type ATP synthase subunit B, partial [Actinomycetia bacterium]|nr:V-type ATP synthase subunit B [Actinomycetes bacterium]